jgi:hypothetical protein
MSIEYKNIYCTCVRNWFDTMEYARTTFVIIYDKYHVRTHLKLMDSTPLLINQLLIEEMILNHEEDEQQEEEGDTGMDVELATLEEAEAILKEDEEEYDAGNVDGEGEEDACKDGEFEQAQDQEEDEEERESKLEESK